MAGAPARTVTFLFTDIEGSTRLLDRLGNSYAAVLKECLQYLRNSTHEQGGQEIGTQGDAFFAVFNRARDAVSAAVSAQRSIAAHKWPHGTMVRVRMGVHTGEGVHTEAGYVGMDVHQTARICEVAHGCQIVLSDAARSLVVATLPSGQCLRYLGTHRLKDLPEPLRLFQVVAEGLPADFPPIRTLTNINNLPRPVSSFVGREKEMAEIKQLLAGTRLLTLSGTGGAGKSRLALQVATDLLDQYPDGIWLVELASLSKPDLLPKAVASVLGLAEPDGPFVEVILKHIGSAAPLLVFDNCEHLLNATAALTNVLLQRCPQLRILATSRQGLGIAGELTYRVPSLSLPDPQQTATPEHLLQSEAVRLFVERASASDHSFQLTSRNARGCSQISIRLDGIPLALELAAARVKVLSVEQIAERLDDRFRLLTGGSRTGLARHQTLRAAMDVSYDLLSREERTVLRRLAVFAGGCTLEAAEVVCSGNRLKATEILDLLSFLVDKSLIRAAAMGAEVRYLMLETVRQYSHDRLVASGEAQEIKKRHRVWCLELANRAAAAINGPEQLTWLDRLEVEHDNLRAALGWSSEEAEDAENRLRLAGALIWFWDYHTHWREAYEWLQAALAEGRHIKSSARAMALARAGLMSFRQRHYDDAVRCYQESLALAQELGDRNGMWRALEGCGFVTEQRGDCDAGIALLEKALDIARDLNNTFAVASTLAQLGRAVQHKGDYVSAAALCEECLVLYRALGAQRGIAYALRLTAHAQRLLGNLKEATVLYMESLTLFKETGDKWIAAECLEGLAIIADAQGRRERGARLLEAATAAREKYGIKMPRPQRAVEERDAFACHPGLSNDSVVAAGMEGRAMTLDRAIEYALSEAF